jgi:P-type Ca2+ transporter type 2C
LRVLGFARKDLADPKRFTENGMIFLGLQAMLDPPRPEVRAAIETCHSAGIRVVMITGDHSQTAAAIGAAIGIKGQILTGKEIDGLDLAAHIERTQIYARVTPEHKLKIVQALQEQGQVVAMTGDGVNDAPALKKADIGIAMGISGTDVAKEAAEMVLTDDNFTSIVNAIHEGRGIYDNIKKFVNFMLSSNFAEVMVIFGGMLIGFRSGGREVLPLLALHILWLNIVTDSLPAMALGADPIDKYAMKKKPRRHGAKIIDRQMIANIGFVGLLIAAATLGLFDWGLARYGLKTAQTMALTLLVLLETARAQMIRQQFNLSLFSNPWLLAALSFTLLLQTAAVYLTPLMRSFGVAISNPLKLEPLPLEIWAIMLAVTAIVSAACIGFSKTLDRWVPD